jgi:hypothetical protein
MLRKIQRHAEKFIKTLIKGLLKIILVTFVLSVFVELSLRFFATPLLSGFLQTYAATKSNGIYSANFDHISIDLISRTVQIKNFTLVPDTDVYKQRVKDDQIRTGLYNIKFDKLTMKGFLILRFLRKRELNLKSIVVSRPTVSLAALPKKNKTKQGKYDAVHQDLFAAVKPFFSAVKVAKIKVNEGVFDFSLSTEAASKKSNAEKVSVNLTQFCLDENSFRFNRKLFYSDNYIIQIRNYRLLLNDGVHEVRARNVRISGIDSVISVSGVSIKPVSENPKQPNIYDIEIPKIYIRGADIYNAWFNNEVFVKDVLIDSAKISLIIQPRQKKKSESDSKTDYRDIYNLIQGKVNSMIVQNFNFQNTQFQFKKSEKENNPDISIQNFSVSMDHFVLDSLSYLRKQKVLYSDNFSMDVSGFQVKIAENTHILKTEKFTLSSKKQEIKAENAEIVPLNTFEKFPTKIIMKIPKFYISGIDFVKVYNSGKLDIAQLLIENPKSKIEKFSKSNKKVQSVSVIYDLVSEYLQSVKIDKILFDKGDIDFSDLTISEKPAFYKGNLTLVLNNFKIDENTAKGTDRLFYADDFEISLNDYSMKSSADFNILNIGQLRLSSQKSQIDIENIKYLPAGEIITPELSASYKKNTVLNLSVDKLSIYQADIKKALFKKELNVAQISIKNPVISVINFPYKIDGESKVKQLLPKDLTDSAKTLNEKQNTVEDSLQNETYKTILKKMLVGNLNLININSIVVDSGFFSYVRKDSSGHNFFSLKTKLSVKAKKIYFRTDTSEITSNFLFSQNIIAQFSDFTTEISGNKNSFKIKNAVYSSSDSALKADFVRILPEKNHSDSLNSESEFSMLIPTITVKGIDFEKFMNQKKLEIRNVRAQKPIINVLFFNQKTDESETDSVKKIKTFKFPKTLKSLSIRNIYIAGGSLRLSRISDGKYITFSKTGFDFQIENLFSDSTQNNKLFPVRTQKALLTLIDFSYPLSDSIYRIQADTIRCFLSDGKLFGRNFKLSYDSASVFDTKTYIASKNKLFWISIPKFNSEGVDFKEFIINKSLNIANIDLKFPEISILKLTSSKEKNTVGEIEKMLQQKITKKIKHLRIDNLSFENADIKYQNIKKTTRENNQRFQISGSVRDFDTDTVKFRTPGRMFLCRDISLKLGNFTSFFKDSLYRFSLDSVNISTENKTVNINKLHLFPTCGRQEFALRNRNFQKGMMFLNTGSITIKNFDYTRFIENRGIKIGSADIENLNFRVFKDKQLPEDSSFRPKFPLDLLKNSKKYVCIDSVRLHNSDFVSEQNSVKSEKSGMISINNIDAVISNITNDSTQFDKRRFIRARMNGMLMGQALMSVSFRFPLENPEEYLYAGSVDTFDLKILNPVLINSAFLSINQGTANTFNFSVEATPDRAEGKMQFYFYDLKMTVIDTAGTKKSFLSTLAGAVLPSDNPTKGRNPKTKEGTISADRLPYKSIYSLWTQSLISGAYSTLGIKNNQVKRSLKINKKVVKMMIDRQKKKNRIKEKNEMRLKREMEKELRQLEKQGKTEEKRKAKNEKLKVKSEK